MRNVDQPQIDPNSHALDAWSVRALWTVRTLSLVAMLVASYLAAVSLTSGGAAIGCGGLPQFDCQHVLTSRWSMWLGVPVSVPAAGAYALLLAATFAVRKPRPAWARLLAGVMLPGFAVLASGAAVWFLVLLVFVVRQICIWCLAVHACGLTIGVMVLRRMRFERGEIGAVVVAAAGLAALAGGQILRPPRSFRLEEFDSSPVVADDTAHTGGDEEDRAPTSGPEQALPLTGAGREQPLPAKVAPKTEPDFEMPIPEPPQKRPAPTAPQPPQNSLPPRSRQVTIFKGRATLDVDAHPLLGKPDSLYILVEMSDYTCKHCREVHGLLKQVRKRYEGDLAVLVLPVPINTDCNKHAKKTHADQKDACHYARLALALWEAAPAEYEKFHDWVFEPQRPPPLDEARRYAQQLAGKQSLADSKTLKAAEQRLDRYVELYRQGGAGSVPKLLYGKYVLTGVPENADELAKALRQIFEGRP